MQTSPQYSMHQLSSRRLCLELLGSTQCSECISDICDECAQGRMAFVNSPYITWLKERGVPCDSMLRPVMIFKRPEGIGCSLQTEIYFIIQEGRTTEWVMEVDSLVYRFRNCSFNQDTWFHIWISCSRLEDHNSLVQTNAVSKCLVRSIDTIHKYLHVIQCISD